MQIYAVNSLRAFPFTLPATGIRRSAGTSVYQKVGTVAAEIARENMLCTRKKSSKDRALHYALNTFSEKTEDLHQSLSSFNFISGNVPKVFRTAMVSDDSKASAEAQSFSTATNYLLDIDILATAQTNHSKVLVSNDAPELSDGTYTFTLTVGTTDHSLSVSIDTSGSDPDTNKDVLEKLAWEIGHTDDSLEAFITQTDRKYYSELSNNLTERVVYLTIRSKTPGDSVQFSLRDVTGSIVDTFNINSIAQRGLEGRYFLNGVSNTSDTNSITADNNRLSVTLLDTTASPIIINVEKGLNPVLEKLAGLISDYNSYVSWLDQNRRYIIPTVKQEIAEEIDTLSSELLSIGLHLNTSGGLNISDDFSHMLQADIDTVREVLTGEKGLFTKVEGKLEDILENEKDAYGLDQNQCFIYSQRGIVDTLFSKYKGLYELSLYL